MVCKIVVVISILVSLGCSSIREDAVIPDTISLEAGTGIRHEPGETSVQTNTALIRVQWKIHK